jgi:lysophospholipid acyltransferase (LPLAT)-like uncharacterized protein
MAKDFKSRYRVDEVPRRWWLLLQLYGWSAGLLVYLYYAVVFLTSRITLYGTPEPGKNYVHCFWHQQIMTFQTLRLRYKRWSLFIHPLWYMYPLHVGGRLMGVSNLVLGSSGNQGVEAAQHLVRHIRAGDNTYFNPDGPSGPPGKVSKGALHVALQSGVPVMPMAVKSTPCIQLKGWDKKELPLPFGKTVVVYGEAFVPQIERLDQDAVALADQMDELSREADHLCKL